MPKSTRYHHQLGGEPERGREVPFAVADDDDTGKRRASAPYPATASGPKRTEGALLTRGEPLQSVSAYS
jgi:hypothetical protein